MEIMRNNYMENTVTGEKCTQRMNWQQPIFTEQRSTFLKSSKSKCSCMCSHIESNIQVTNTKTKTRREHVELQGKLKNPRKKERKCSFPERKV